jgi:hypothetical protein
MLLGPLYTDLGRLRMRRRHITGSFACATDDVLEEIGGDVLSALAAAPGDMRRSEKLE